MITVKPRLHEDLHVAVNIYMYVDGNMLPGNRLLVRATCCLYLGNNYYSFTSRSTCILLYTTTDGQQTDNNFVADIYKQHVDGNMLPLCKRGLTSLSQTLQFVVFSAISLLHKCDRRTVLMTQNVRQTLVYNT